MGKIISNYKIDNSKIEIASRIISDLQKDISKFAADGYGPFVAAIYDEKYSLVAKTVNSVVKDNNSNAHAEMKAIKLAEEKYGSYDLSPFNLKLYITSEPCMMCLGAIMWSGIKEVYYGVPSDSVEKITGFCEGYKPNWMEEFKKLGISVCGNIEADLGEQELLKYVAGGKKIYNPSR